MSSPRWQKLKEIVDQALDCAPSERARLLDAICPDPELRQEVESLLAQEHEAFLEKAAVSLKEGPPPEPIGATFARYEILGRIGRGGMGEVFLAHDASLDRRVALKLLPEELQHDEDAKKRLLREARSAAALDHPYICKIYEIGEAEGRPFIAMEYVNGETLGARMARGELSLDEVQAIAREIAEALEMAHGEGIVHRDLKPSNIMLTAGGHVKVLDFGLAKRVAKASADSQRETADRVTEEGAALGTVAYMSPEQHRLQSVDLRSDIFAFGVVLYEMVAGVHPFTRDTAIDTASAILNETPGLLSLHRRDIPEAFERVIGKMLEKTPERRYQLVDEVRTELSLIGEAPMTPAGSASFGRRWGRLALAGLVMAATAGLWTFWPEAPDGSRNRIAGSVAVPSLAVLPMTNISEDPRDSDYLADGISQAVITRLAQVGLRVTPWETTRRFKGSVEPAEAIAQQLNVDAVLSGTFQVAGDEILTNLSLVESQTGFVSWADAIVERYDDIFQMQLRIAVGVAASLKEELTGEEERALGTPESNSVDAYEHYLNGSSYLQEGGEEATSVAFQYFERATELDPGLAEAHVGLGAAHFDNYYYGWGGLKSLENARESYERALELDPESVRARRGLIMLNLVAGTSENCLMQGSEAETYGGPDDVETLLARAEAYVCAYAGEPSPLFQRVIDLDPLNAEAYFWVTTGAWSSNLEQSLEAGETYLRLFGDDLEVHTFMGFSAQFLGDHKRALASYETAGWGEVSGESNISSLIFGGILLDELGDRERAEAFWRRGVELVGPRAEAYPDNVRMRLFLASFHGLLNEDASFRREEEQALEIPGAFQHEVLYHLAAIHARRGETERAVELASAMVQAGRLDNLFETYLRLAFAYPLESERLNAVIERADAERERLLRTY